MSAGWIGIMCWLLAATAWAEPPSGEDAAVMKVVRRAERAGFERHQLKRYLAAFTADAVWTFGREGEPGPYDRRFERPQFERYRALDWSLPASGRDRVYFHDPVVTRAGDTAQVEVEVRLTFFGGELTEGRRYALRRDQAGWQISAVRSWPKLEQLGMERNVFNPEEWARMDKELAVSEGVDALTGQARVLALAMARRYAEACDLARELARASQAEGRPDSRDLLAWASLAVEANRLDEAREVLDGLVAADPAAEIPRALQVLQAEGGKKKRRPGKGPTGR